MPDVAEECIDRASSFSKIASWSLTASRGVVDLDPDLVVGAPSYGHYSFMRAIGRHGFTPPCACVAYVWNNADWYREKQLRPEYAMYGQEMPTQRVNTIMNEAALEYCDALIACSDFVAGTWSKVFPESDIKIARWGVDSEVFHPGDKDPRFTILFVGGDPIRKGLVYLLRAIPALFKEYDFQIIVVGCKVGAGHSSITELGMIPHADMPALMRRAHVLVLPTLEDGIAVSVQEAMASGVVPITTHECAEVFEDKISGFEVPYRSTEEIVKRLRGLLDDEDMLRDMSSQARLVAEKQTWGRFRSEFADAIRGL